MASDRESVALLEEVSKAGPAAMARVVAVKAAEEAQQILSPDRFRLSPSLPFLSPDRVRLSPSLPFLSLGRPIPILYHRWCLLS